MRRSVAGVPVGASPPASGSSKSSSARRSAAGDVGERAPAERSRHDCGQRVGKRFGVNGRGPGCTHLLAASPDFCGQICRFRVDAFEHCVDERAERGPAGEGVHQRPGAGSGCHWAGSDGRQVGLIGRGYLVGFAGDTRAGAVAGSDAGVGGAAPERVEVAVTGGDVENAGRFSGRRPFAPAGCCLGAGPPRRR